MSALLGAVLLVVAVAALSAAAWRAAGLVAAPGLQCLLAAAVLACAFAVASTLALGLVGLGGSPLALTVAVMAAWALSLRLPGGEPWSALTGWWGSLSPAERAARGALLAASVVYGAWVLRHPVIGLDGLTDHLALPVEWVQRGHPGAEVTVNAAVPYADYPNTHELLLTWVTGVARTLVAAQLLTAATLLLLGAAVRGGLAELGVNPLPAWLAAAVMCTLPVAVVQLGGPNTDVPATAWLAVTAALAAGARRRPGLLAVAIVSAGLAVGTKTTPAPLCLLALVLGLWSARGALRRRWLQLAGGVAAAVVVGGMWYLRDLVEHGSPLWPFSTTPWGDPIPPAFRAIHASLLSNFHRTLDGRLEQYEAVLAGGLVAGAGALLAPLWARRWVAVAGALVVAAALLDWAAAPYTGISASTQLAVGATRYLLPWVLAACVTVALAGRRSPRASVKLDPRQIVAPLLLLGALGWNLDRDWILGFPNAPAPGTLLLAAAIGAAIVTVLAVVWNRRGVVSSRPAAAAAVAAGALAATAVVALALPVDGFLSRHVATRQFDAGLIGWLDERAGFRSGDAPVAIAPVAVATAAGTRLKHRLTVLSGGESCAELRGRADHGWLALQLDPSARPYVRAALACLNRRRPAFLDPSFVVYAPPALTRPAGP